MLKQFIEIADSANCSIENFKNDHVKICSFLDIDISSGYSRSVVTETFKNNIGKLLTPDSSNSVISYKEIIALEDSIVYDSILNSKNNSEYLAVIEKIRSSCTTYKSLAEEKSWKQAVINAKNYCAFEHYNNNYDPSTLRTQRPKQVDTGLAAKKLKEMGCEVIINNNSLEVISGLEVIVERIENEIKKLGGVCVLKFLFDNLLKQGRYLPQLERYIIIQESHFNPANIIPFIPYGYVLNLSVKYPFDYSEKMKPTAVQEKLNYIVNTATLLSTILELQHYSAWTIHLQRPETMPDFVRNTALFDSIISFTQGKGDDEVASLLPLFDWVDEAYFEDTFGFALIEIVNTIKCIQEISRTLCGPVVIYQSSLKKLMRDVSDEKLQKILYRISHEQKAINTEYKFCTDFEKSNFHNYPLIKITATKYLLCDKSWCAPAYYESIAALTRQLYTGADRKIGLALEQFIYSIFNSKKIHFSYGNYVKPLAGQCDMLIEGENAIILIEIKKKALTRKSKSGIDTSIVIDLTSSLLEAQVQNGRTEILLRKNGFIELEDPSGNIHRIDLKGRAIERIALSHLDFGSFQDRSVINGFLKNLINTRVLPISNGDPKIVEGFNKLEKERIEWEKQFTELSALDPNFDHFPFFNCWYLSIQQLMLILDYSSDNESFIKALLSTKHVTLSSLNFYYEFYLANFRNRKP